VTPAKKKLLNWTVGILMLAAAGVLIATFNQGESKPVPRPTVPAGNGIVEGIVKFDAPRPPVQMIGGCKECVPVPDESTVVNIDGTLKNVVIYVKDGPNVAADAPPLTMDQKGCRYLPHVLAAHTDQPIDVTSHDATMHNIDVQASINPPQNFSESFVDATYRLSFAKPEMIHVKCDVHPWMSAYLCIFDHPFFAVTGDDGKFRIPRLPAGSYTLIAWHERYGSLEQSFTVTDDKPADVIFDFKGP
jgi:hypothetical protein